MKNVNMFNILLIWLTSNGVWVSRHVMKCKYINVFGRRDSTCNGLNFFMLLSFMGLGSMKIDDVK